MKRTPPKRCQAKGCKKIAKREYEHAHDVKRYFCKRHWYQYVQKVMGQMEVIMSDMTEEEFQQFTILTLLKMGLS